MSGELELRPATAADAPSAVPLIHDAGPVSFRWVFSETTYAQSLDFLDYSFRRGDGQFGWRNHLVAERDGAVLATVAVWDARLNATFTLSAIRHITAFYGLRAAAVMLRGLRFERVVCPPPGGVAYIGQFAVLPQSRGQGLGRAVLRHLLAQAAADGYARAGLDVAETNPRARSLYEGLGFRLVGTRRAALAQRWGEQVADHHYLECAL